jgi:hypothetical protein
LDDVKPADDPLETGLLRHSRERAVSVVVEVLELVVDPHVRDHEIEVTVVVEIFQNHAASRSELIDAPSHRHVAKSADVII